jgi:hypothetical protein
LRDDSVSEEVEALVQFGGKPIIHSTKRGLRCNPSDDARPPGRHTASVSVVPAFLPDSLVQLPDVPDFLQSRAVGVGSIPRAARSGNVCEFRFSLVTPLQSRAVGVGSEQEDAIAEVRGADGCRWHTVPFRSPPARCQVAEDFAERLPVVNTEQSGHVFDEQRTGTSLSDDSPDVRPEPSLVVDASSFAGNACALAGESGNDEIHPSTKRAAIEGFQIAPDRTRIQGTFRHSIREDGCCVGLPLDSSHRANGDASKADPEFESAVSRAQADGT